MLWWLVGMGSALALSLVLFVASAAHVLSFGPVATQADSAEAIDDGAPVQELAERLLASPQLGHDGGIPRVWLLPGQMPIGMPLELPIPPYARLIGSAVRDSAPAPGMYVVLDAAVGADDVLSFYRRELSGRGWREMFTWTPDDDARLEPGMIPASGAYCQGPRGPWLLISAFPRPDGPTDVRVYVDVQTPGPCASPRDPGRPDRSPDRDRPPPSRPPRA